MGISCREIADFWEKFNSDQGWADQDIFEWEKVDPVHFLQET